MNTASTCPVCHAVIPADAPGGLCPACALLGAAQPTISMPSPAGAMPSREELAAAFPDLEILDVLGQGGMGVVFKARQQRLERPVALKILPPHLAAQPGFIQRFTREARALALLSHPNIVAVYDFGERAGYCYLLMEFVNGVNLRQAMRAGVKPEQALTLVPRICEALQFAHDHGVLHRDIKPENILLDTYGTPKLADFGIAKLAGDHAGGLTLSGATLGTAAYMAPEQIERPATVDHRADIYSLGVVLYEMLTGELPLGRFAAPSQKSKVSESVDEVVMRALEKERDRRQQSATEMKTQVEGARDALPVATVQDDVPEHSPIKHLLLILMTLSGIGIPASAVIPGLAPYITPAIMVFVTTAFGALYSLWPGGRPRPPQRAPGLNPTPWETRSSRTLFGIPLYHIVNGIDPATGRSRIARGILAIGPEARGFLAIGGRAHGFIAIGGMATGMLAIGGMAAGVLAAGGLSLGLLAASGGMAVGALARGGIAMGYNVEGGIAAGHFAKGGRVFTDAAGLPESVAAGSTEFLVHVTLVTGAFIVVTALLVLLLCFLTFLSRREPPVAQGMPVPKPWPGWIFPLIALFVVAPFVMRWAQRARPFDRESHYQSAPAVDTVRPDRSPFHGRWEKGTVELVAVSRYPIDNAPWWRMDGLMSTEGPFTWPGGQCFEGRGERGYRFVFRLRDLPEGASPPEWLVDQARAMAGGGPPALAAKPESPLPGHFSFAAILPDSIDRTNIKIGVAFDDWFTLSESSPINFPGLTRSHEGTEWSVTHRTAVETRDGDLAVTFSHSRPHDWESRVVAVKNANDEVATGRTSNVNDQSEWRFEKLTLADVKKFRFQVRRIRWVEFRGVSLNPGT